MSRDTQDPSEAKDQLINALERCMALLAWYSDTPEEVLDMMENVSAPSCYGGFVFDDEGVTSEFCTDPTGAIRVHLHVNVTPQMHYDVRICAPTIHQMPVTATSAATHVLQETCEVASRCEVVLQQSLPICSEEVASQAMSNAVQEYRETMRKAGFEEAPSSLN